MREINQAMALFPELARRADLPADGWTPQLISRRDDQHMSRIVLALRRPGSADLILKHVLSPQDSESFARSMQAQAALCDHVPGVPQVFAFDAMAQIVLMQRLSGSTLFDLCVNTQLQTHTRHLQNVGRWMATLHRAKGAEPRVFQTKYMVQQLKRLDSSIQSGRRQVARRPQFLSCLNWLQENLPTGKDLNTIAGLGHGDMNMRNLILEDRTVGAIDFQQGRVVPVGHDLARLFTHYGAFLPSLKNQNTGPLPGVSLGAFFKGYDVIPPEDQTLASLVRMRLLVDWAAIPKLKTHRSAAQQIRFRGVQRLAERAFA